LQVKPSRTVAGRLNKSWLFRFAMAGRERQMGLGSLRTFGLHDAREAARRCRELVAEGTDPIEARDTQKAAKGQAALAQSRTFERAALRNAKRRWQWNQTLRTFAYRSSAIRRSAALPPMTATHELLGRGARRDRSLWPPRPPDRAATSPFHHRRDRSRSVRFALAGQHCADQKPHSRFPSPSATHGSRR
jgi:hypothetical protein